MLKKSSMLWQVILAIILGMVVGSLTGQTAEIFGTTYFSIFSFFGQLFLNGLTLLVVPLVASAIINGISQMGKDQSFKRLGGKTFFFYILTTFLAVLTGLILVNIIKPGLYHDASGATASTLSPLIQHAPNDHMAAIGDVITKLIPANIFEAAASGNMLGIIFFSLLFGFAAWRIERSAFSTLSRAF